MCTNNKELRSLMLHIKFHQNLPSGSLKEYSKCFYHKRALQPSWSCDLQNVDEFSLTCTYKLSFKIWLKMGQCF